ncbi:oligopeptide transporter [Phlyctema vagabunda]|uniref:Oligopeptide transporter n=1 Tax=Phlyctema vagabunda TaxID=108571 RepID=A0ABR4PCY6_9HELO
MSIIVSPVATPSKLDHFNPEQLDSYDTEKNIEDPAGTSTVQTRSLKGSIDQSTDGDKRPVATEEEIKNLTHVVDDIPFRLWIACFAGILERFVWYGATAPLQNYIQNARGGEIPGTLGLGQVTASNVVNALMIATSLTPMLAAILADSFLGRYKTMVYSAFIEAIGATLLFATSLPVAIEGGAALGGLIAACVLLSVGTGAFSSTVVPFIADQYEETEYRIKIQKNGVKVVTSRELTITYIYNVFYWAVNIAALLAETVTLMERYVGFWLAYLVPCCAMWLALLPVLFGKPYYIEIIPTVNIVPQAAKALWYGVVGKFQMDEAKPAVQLEKHNRTVKWSSTFVDDIKLSLLTCRVLLLFPVHWLALNQTFNNLISQAGEMITYGIPNDMLKVTGAIAGIIVAPIIQNGLYPFLEQRKIRFGPVARMTAGFAILTLCMAYTAIVQKIIYNAGPCYDHPLDCPAAEGRVVPNRVSVFLQIPIYFGGALTEVLCLTTGTEYAYNRAPKSMKSLVQAIWLSMSGIGSLLALALSPLSEDPRLVILYALLAGLLGISTVALWVIFGYLDKEDTVLL